MFGYLKLPRRARCDSKKQYRQVYASLCSSQRQKFGVRASILISYESVFLYQLAVDAGLVKCPAENTPTCCRLRNDWSNAWQANLEAAEFANAFAILLARIKIEDDVRDSGKWLARGSSLFWSKAFRHANQYFDGVDGSLVASIERLVDEHIDLEHQPFSGSPEDYAAPTANAFGLVFRCFAEQLSAKSDEQVERSQVDLFYKIGQGIGAGILLSDCVFDFQKDRRRGEFNPIKNPNQLSLYQQAALKAFSQAGWDCEALAIDDCWPVSGAILKYAFERIARFSTVLVEKPVRRLRLDRRLYRRSSMRAGECDIPCDACCDCGGCDGCDCGGCDCGGGGDIGADTSSTPMCFHGSCCCDACVCEPGSKKRSAEPDSFNTIESLKPDSVLDANVVDLVGETDCPLNPSGYIVIDGERYPAKTNGEFIDAGQKVLVLSRSTFGFIVELAGE